ncbi:hypothetical protein BGX26_001784 [Mortierella sp. AD094]|nr:hypothetical protein BGX26_001784 [Mortierella sp. AD094]
MSSSPAMYSATPQPAQKTYSAPGVANLPYNQRPLPPGWISQYDATQQAFFYIYERTNPPMTTWEDPRPAYYMAQERGQYAPPPGIEGRPPVQDQQQQQFQTVQTVQKDGTTTTTTITSNGQPIQIVNQPAPQQQQQQQQQQSSGPSVGRAIVGTAVVTSLLRPRVVVAPRRRR